MSANRSVELDAQARVARGVDVPAAERPLQREPRDDKAQAVAAEPKAPPAAEPPAPPRANPDNLTGIDYFSDRHHLLYARSDIIDIHTHIVLAGPDGGEKTADGAARMLEVARQFGVCLSMTMCDPGHIPVLRQQFGSELLFNGHIYRRGREPESKAFERLDAYLNENVTALKFWSAPGGRPDGLLVNAPYRIEAARRAIAAGVRLFMVHCGDPTTWWQRQDKYYDYDRFGTKDDQYPGLRRMLEQFPDANWIAAHMLGSPEEPERIAAFLERYPHLYLDTSATKWQVREVSSRANEIQQLMISYPDRFLFGTDLVVNHTRDQTHYASRYWCQRTLWESDWEGQSPIADPDTPKLTDGTQPASPTLRGLGLPHDVIDKLYRLNSAGLLGLRS